MTPAEIRQHLLGRDPAILIADGFDEALLGEVTVFNRTVALYDQEKCIEILMTRDGMTEEAAREYFDFNVTGAYAGRYTPAFATLLRKP